MKDHVNEWPRAAPYHPPREGGLRRRALCKSGLSLSIQASRWHYCTPREDRAEVYSTVEVGYPEKSGRGVRFRSLRAYADGGEVYAYVPVEALNRVIARNGGIVGVDA